MTKLFEQAIAQVRKLPATLQDLAAREIMGRSEEPLQGDLASIAEGRRAFARGDVVPLTNPWIDDNSGDDVELSHQ